MKVTERNLRFFRRGHRIKILAGLLLTIAPIFAGSGNLGLVVFVTGKCHKEISNQKTALRFNDLVEAQTRITTASESSATLQFKSGIQAMIQENSSITVSEISKKYLKIGLTQGTIVSRKDKKVRSKYDIKTPSAIASVRGTDFIMEVDPSTKTTQLMVAAGVVEITNLDGTRSAAIEAGSKVVIDTRGFQKSIIEAHEKKRFEIFEEFDKLKKDNIEMLIEQKERDQKLMQQLKN